MLSGQPRGLYTLCFTEMWERFGYYMVQAIFILFLTQKLLVSEGQADLLYGAFAGLLYVTPVVGGWLADNYLGFRRAIVLGAVLLFIGYMLLILSELRFFYLGLSFLIVGNGFLKPNVSSIVGDLYTNDEGKREGGFTLFYMGINIGSIVPPIIAGSVINHWGWHYGFALAAIGMVISVITFLAGGRAIWHIGNIPEESPLKQGARQRLVFNIKLYAGLLLAVGLFYLGILESRYTNVIILAAGLLFFVCVVFYLLREDPRHRNNMLVCLALITLSIGFWALYNQTFTSLTLFANRNMNLHLLGWTITPEFTQFYNGFFIIALSPLFNYLWTWLEKYRLNPSIPFKFALAIGFMCLGFFFLVWGTNGSYGQGGVISGWWLIGSYFLQTIGELLLSPIGLAMITVLAPKHLVGMMMGVWFFALACASSLAGYLANYAAMPKDQDLLTALGIYHHAFVQWSWMSVGLVVVSFFCYPFLKRTITME